MAQKKFKKEDFIRELLMKTVGKSPDLFSYYVNLREAKELLGKDISENMNSKEALQKPKRIIIDC